MKSVFIRGLWGIYDKSHRVLNRRYRIDNNISEVLNNELSVQFVTYVFGKDNYNQLLSTGIEQKGHKVILIHNDPSKFDLVQHQYRHKLEIINYAMTVDKYDEIVAIDWDCFNKKECPRDFWEYMRTKQVMQGCLQHYKHPECGWRTDDTAKRRVPNGGFLYIRDKEIPQELIKIWENKPVNKPDTDESTYAFFMEKLMGGKWNNDMEYYWNNFEPMHCQLRRMSAYPREKWENIKDVCFVHHL